MKRLPLQGRTLALLAIIVPTLALFLYVALSSGPLSSVAITVTTVKNTPINPALYGIGTVEARYTYKVGPTSPGRVKSIDVQVGDFVKAGQLLAEMDPVDLDDRVTSQDEALKRAQAMLREATSKQVFAEKQARRYEQLLAAGSTSEEIYALKKQDLDNANADLASAKSDQARSQADLDATKAERNHLHLTAPFDGLVTVRALDPGSTAVAGQSVVEIVDPNSLWINTRINQSDADGLARDLPVQIVLRSRLNQPLAGHVLRVEPKADNVTEETLIKVNFDQQPQPLPPIGELTEVTISLPALPAAPTIPNAAIQGNGSQTGVWKIVDGKLRFTPVKLGRSDLDGQVQIKEGLKAGDQIVLYSEQALTAHSSFHKVEQIPGVAP